MPFKIAILALRENWRSAVLSALGVTIASIAIILLVSIGLGVQKDISGQVDELGVNVLVVVPGKWTSSMGFNPNIGGQSHLQAEDAERLAKVPGVSKTAILTFAGGGLKTGEQEAFPMMIGCSPAWFDIHGAKLKEGRYLQNSDGAADVMVLGAFAKTTLYGEKSALGKTIQFNAKEYRIVGVLEDRGTSQSPFAMGSFQNVAYVPIANISLNNPQMQINRVMVQSRTDADPKLLVPALDAAMAKHHSDQEYTVLTQEDLLGLVFRVMGILGTLVVGLTSIALFVGGIGIMTVMLMSVNERRVEIGIRRAVGANQGAIFKQFLLEAVLIGIAGSLVGLAVSAVVCGLLASLTTIKPIMTLETVGLALGVGVFVGAIFGTWPARRAARLDPVVTLRTG